VLLIAILTVCLGLFVIVQALPPLFGSDSRLPDGIGFFVLAVMVAAICWLMGAWWVLLPIALLVAWVHWLDKEVRDGPADPAALDEDGTSARTRVRGVRWGTAAIVAASLFCASFVLPGIGAGAEILDLLVPGLVVALVATGLFRFSYYRSVRRDDIA
jgi:hypothetical protein